MVSYKNMNGIPIQTLQDHTLEVSFHILQVRLIKDLEEGRLLAN